MKQKLGLKMKARLSKQGFSILELVVGLVVIFAIVGLGLYGWNRYNSRTSNSTTSDTKPSTAEPSAEPINNSADLDKADKALKQTDVSGSDESELDSQLTF